MGPSSSSARSKRQTRLQFNLLQSSSPQSTNYPAQIRDRAARVTYEGSPRSAKRRKINDHDPSSEFGAQQNTCFRPKVNLLNIRLIGNPFGLETPKHTSQIQASQSDSDSDPVRLSSRKSSGRRENGSGKRVTPKGVEKDMFSSPLRSASSGVGMFGARDSAINLSSGEESPSSSGGQPEPSARRTRGNLINMSAANQKNKGISGRIMRGKAPTTTIESESEDGARASPERSIHRDLDNLGEAETSGDEIIVTSKPRPSQSKVSTRSRKPKKRTNETHGFIDDEDDEESDIQIIKESKLNHANVISDEEEGENDDEAESEGDNEDDAEDDDDLPITPRKRRNHFEAKSRTPHKSTRREREDLDEDLKFLQPSEDDEPQPTSRIRKRKLPTPKQSARTRALEALKKRRAGKQIAISDDDEDEGNSGLEVNLGNEYDSENLQEPADYSVENGLPSSNAVAMFEEDENDEGFIIEDEEDPLGAPSSALPIEFSGLQSRKPKELFKFAIEWMVQKKFNPAFQMNDDVYRLTFDKLNDEVKGLVGSKFVSAAWTPEFTRALQARPQIEDYEIGSSMAGMLHNKCGACNRSGHPATWQVRFSGTPYYEETLEDVEQEDDEDEDNDDNDGSDDEEEYGTTKADHDSKGRPIPSSKKTFEVGKFCMRNARIGHALAHWRYHLNEWVIDYLRAEGYLTPEKIVERDSWNVRKRRDFANSVVDDMEEKGEIKRLQRDYRTEIDSAREAKTEDRFAKF